MTGGPEPQFRRCPRLRRRRGARAIDSRAWSLRGKRPVHQVMSVPPGGTDRHRPARHDGQEHRCPSSADLHRSSDGAGRLATRSTRRTIARLSQKPRGLNPKVATLRRSHPDLRRRVNPSPTVVAPASHRRGSLRERTPEAGGRRRSIPAPGTARGGSALGARRRRVPLLRLLARARRGSVLTAREPCRSRVPAVRGQGSTG